MELSRRKFLYAGAGVVAVAGIGYITKDYWLPSPLASPSLSPTASPIITESPQTTFTETTAMSTTEATTSGKLVDLELQLFHDYHGDGAKQDDEPIISDAIIDVRDENGEKVLTEIKGNGNGIYRFDDIVEGKKYVMEFNDETRKKYPYVSSSNSEIQSYSNYEFIIEPEKTRIDLGLTPGLFTLPIKEGTKWYFRSESFVDIDPGPGMRDWKGERQTYVGHRGVDFFMSDGSPILAAAPGKVVSTDASQLGWARRYVGNIIVIGHPMGYNTLHCHLKERLAEDGDVVNRGQVIGLCGHSGDYSIGPQKNKPMSKSVSHLHFQVCPGIWWQCENQQDPYRNIKKTNSISLWTKDNDPQYSIPDE